MSKTHSKPVNDETMTPRMSGNRNRAMERSTQYPSGTGHYSRAERHRPIIISKGESWATTCRINVNTVQPLHTQRGGWGETEPTKRREKRGLTVPHRTMGGRITHSDRDSDRGRGRQDENMKNKKTGEQAQVLCNTMGGQIAVFPDQPRLGVGRGQRGSAGCRQNYNCMFLADTPVRRPLRPGVGTRPLPS